MGKTTRLGRMGATKFLLCDKPLMRRTNVSPTFIPFVPKFFVLKVDEAFLSDHSLMFVHLSR